MEQLQNEEWVISLSDEYFNGEMYATKEAAISAAAAYYDLLPGATFFVGKVRHLSAPIVDAEDISERIFEGICDDIEERMLDEASEGAEGYPRDGISVEVRAEALKDIAAIITRTMPTPTFYLVTNVEEITVPREGELFQARPLSKE